MCRKILIGIINLFLGKYEFPFPISFGLRNVVLSMAWLTKFSPFLANNSTKKTFIILTLLKNDYPLNFIFSAINRRLIYNILHKNTSNAIKGALNIKFFTILYVRSVSDKFQTMIKKIQFYFLVFIH